MSRSFKKQPFMSICGNTSAKQDKRLANRGVRRAHRHALKITQDFEDFLPPHRLECHWNEVYSWVRDGHQIYQGPRPKDWQDYLKAQADIAAGVDSWEARYDRNWPPDWYQEMMRK